ncbi:hypothetical protein SUGI_0719010 [Cryptomeria japonica]|nr:hypothetical protein SUGI_0719010 [Cryptomeria japonica]
MITLWLEEAQQGVLWLQLCHSTILFCYWKGEILPMEMPTLNTLKALSRFLGIPANSLTSWRDLSQKREAVGKGKRSRRWISH